MGFFRGLVRFLLGGGITIDLSKKREKPETVERTIKDIPRVSQDDLSKETIEEVVSSIFAEGYDIKRNMSLSGEEDDYKCSYIIFDSNENLKMIIQVVPHNGQNNRFYYNLRKICEENNIKFVNFYSHMTNEKSYVEERIKAAL